jgi:hypothetical protein
MPHEVKLRNGETQKIDLGVGNGGLVVTNTAQAAIEVLIEYNTGAGYAPIDKGPRKRLAAGGPPLVRKREEIGHDHIRVGVEGPDNEPLAKVVW